MRPVIVARQALVVALSVLWLIGGAEALERFEGGWQFDHLALLKRVETCSSGR